MEKEDLKKKMQQSVDVSRQMLQAIDDDVDMPTAIMGTAILLRHMLDASDEKSNKIAREVVDSILKKDGFTAVVQSYDLSDLENETPS